MKAARFESPSLSPDTRIPNNDSSQIMNWHKYLNQNTKAMWTGTALGSVPMNDLYLRYCLMLEPDILVGMNEIGVKLAGFKALPQNVVSTTMWHAQPDAQGRIRLTTYWWGEGLQTDKWWAADLITGRYLIPGQWHCLEQHLKLNSMNPDGTPNADAVMEAWLDDALIFSKSNFVIHRYTGPNLGIDAVHGQIYHGGQSVPLKPIHYRMTGFALAKRRIGMPRPAP